VTSTHRAVRRVLRSRVSTPLTRPASDLLDSRIRRISGRQDRPVREEVERLRAEVDALTTQVRDLTKAVERSAKLSPALELFTGHKLPRMNRALTDAAFETLVSQVRGVVGDRPRVDHHVAVGVVTLLELEARGLGRIAGGTPNVVGKLTTTPLLDPPNDEVLEIGTLFGLFASGLHRQLCRRGRAPKLTIVDPLDGVQLQPGHKDGPDQTTVPVVEAVLRHNLRLSGVPDDDVRVLRGFSSDKQVRALAGDRQYGVVVVDGDHSAEGVASDLEWVEKLVAPGGVVVLDDYGDKKWPGVQGAADTHLEGTTRLSMIGVVASSAFLRAT
jgi:hypothetical protein